MKRLPGFLAKNCFSLFRIVKHNSRINTMEPMIVVAIINACCQVFIVSIKEIGDWAATRKNADKADEKALTTKSVNAVSSSKQLERNEALRSLKRRMGRTDFEVKSLQKRIKIIESELVLERRADEAITTYGNNVQVIMLFHGLGSVFLQVNYPYIGVQVSILMIVSFFFAFMVSFIVTFGKIEKVSQSEKDLQRRLRELQNEITYFAATIERTCSDRELKTLASIGTLGEVLNQIGLQNRNVAALQKTVTGFLELSSNNSESRMKSLFLVSVGAIIYGLCFPMMAYYLIYFIDLRKMGLAISM
ncbi:uncharacterized protein LOC130753956 isoform X2 [Actinidia eriantha]|uniref:uncharacterized protein LOC130753956 isoform X2 n=1 Tax=Actinidia eriantha TaxID=165200 RepID=UPI00258F9E20|nr:uncharacterized protein LOC130753956 isoform X2 [Actinidia eriantha]